MSNAWEEISQQELNELYSEFAELQKPPIPDFKAVAWDFNKLMWLGITILACCAAWATVAVFVWHGSPWGQ